MARPTKHPTSERLSRTNPMPEMRRDQVHRFWFSIQRKDGSECWFWQGATSKAGYGRVKLGGKLYSPHRVAYHLAKGAIPDRPAYHGTMVMHTCDNPRCCNPEHLKLGTAQDNAKDMADKGRNFCPRGQPHPIRAKSV